MNRYPIIANGEMYVDSIEKKYFSGEKYMPKDYLSAKKIVLGALSCLSESIKSKEDLFLDKKVICIRLEPKFEAKSYEPQAVVNAMGKNQSTIIGGRKYSYYDENNSKVSSKMYFVRTTDEGISKLSTILQSSVKDSNKQWRRQIQSIKTIDLLKPEERFLGFDEDWNNGTVEFVLHPMGTESDNEIESFFKLSGIDRKNAKVRSYNDGITFISAKCSVLNIEKINKYNPLRNAHPLGTIKITPMRSIDNAFSSTLSHIIQKPRVRIGVFDGGVDVNNPFLKGFVEEHDCSLFPANKDFVSHGIGVCCAILRGNLDEYIKTGNLTIPNVAVDSFRVFPLQDDGDYDLYEVIDEVEKVVPQEKGIRLFNLSIGPCGAIIDDCISRFTYALDLLSYNVSESERNPLFVVAVGNDGCLPEPFNRIQSPADMVNGIGVGAYTYGKQREIIPADYSCVGPGREGSKVKPDVLDFGGDSNNPFIIPSVDGKGFCASAGTSFSAPLVTGKIGYLMALSDSISPHIGRSLIIHNAFYQSNLPRAKQGFGICTNNVKSILECSSNRVTYLYSGTIVPGKSLMMPIFAPQISKMRGNVRISWTITAVVSPYSNDSDAYTNNCIEDTFYPNNYVYSFTKHGEKERTINTLNVDNEAIIDLIDRGYKRSILPKSHSAKSEEKLRNEDYKWDTIIHKEVSMRCSSLVDPFLTLHAIGRNGFGDRIRYFAVISIDSPKYEGSLYDKVLQTYRNLSPIKIKEETRVLV